MERSSASAASQNLSFIPTWADGMRKHLILASALTLFPLYAHAASSIPNDCWFGVMAPDRAPHGQLVASGPVAQWRVGMSLVLYPTKEDYAALNALAEKGQTGTFDSSRPITVIPTWLSGPEQRITRSNRAGCSRKACAKRAGRQSSVVPNFANNPTPLERAGAPDVCYATKHCGKLLSVLDY